MKLLPSCRTHYLISCVVVVMCLAAMIGFSAYATWVNTEGWERVLMFTGPPTILFVIAGICRQVETDNWMW